MDKRHHVSERRGRSRSKAETQDRRDPQRVVNEDRAAELLGVSARDLRRLSSETGLGHVESEQGQERVVFTYAELYRLCRSAVLVAD
jgi:hypothetical protein